MQITIHLDKLFNLGSGNDSKLKRIAQGFDQKTGDCGDFSKAASQQYRLERRGVLLR
jgi:hypothetical protein